MKNIYRLAAVFSVVFFTLVTISKAQDFKKGSFLISVTEGSTNSNYSVYNESPTHPVFRSEDIRGCRDPLSLEYGLTNHFGIGLTMGTDIFTINPDGFYGTDIFSQQAKSSTSETTIDVSYHFYATEKADVSITGSFGGSSVNIKGKNSDQPYQYTAGGAIVRLGMHARYYFYKRLGLITMLSTYSSHCYTTQVKGNTFGNGYSTKITGYALEFGFCFRIGRK